MTDKNAASQTYVFSAECPATPAAERTQHTSWSEIKLKKVAELEEQLATALAENAELREQLESERATK